MIGRSLLALALMLLPSIVKAEEVDLMLVLAADISLSMDEHELKIQRQGYADALSHEQIYYAIDLGQRKKIAVTYVEWSSADKQSVVIPWTKLETQEDLDRLATKMRDTPIVSGERTAIGSALQFSAALFGVSEYTSERKVIDISGDGPSNMGVSVGPVRDALVSRGITINGLPIMPKSDERWPSTLPPLDMYYEQCVIGGPEAFSVPINGVEEIEIGLRMKLIREIADLRAEAHMMHAAGSTYIKVICSDLE